ncbi:MAG: hypothetical protein KDK91_34175 [Gammaproteobacteria bacterium]|nr:hypothetical protein [Gammaproteobacteria bacterium]
MQYASPTPIAERENDEIKILTEEYRAMYSLALFRLGALDRRVPATAATLGAFLGSVAVLPGPSREIVLVGVPLAAIWLVRITINHARSFEDALRRIEWIEQRINLHLRAEVLGFQSRHPSRGHAVGGRTGRESISAVLAAAILLVTACWRVFERTLAAGAAEAWAYRLFVAVLVVYLGAVVVALRCYRYEPRSRLHDETPRILRCATQD